MTAIDRHGLRELLAMNATERAYVREVLEPKVRDGHILAYRYEALTLRLGYRLTYTPDFLVEDSRGELELHEVKTTWRGGRAGWREDARVKFKAAAAAFPWFRFRSAVRLPSNRGWDIRTMPSGPMPSERNKR